MSTVQYSIVDLRVIRTQICKNVHIGIAQARNLPNITKLGYRLIYITICYIYKTLLAFLDKRV